MLKNNKFEDFNENKYSKPYKRINFFLCIMVNFSNLHFFFIYDRNEFQFFYPI